MSEVKTISKKKVMLYRIVYFIFGMTTMLAWLSLSDKYLWLDPPTQSHEQYGKMYNDFKNIDFDASDLKKVEEIAKKYDAKYDPQSHMIWMPEDKSGTLVEASLLYRLSFGLVGKKTYYSYMNGIQGLRLKDARGK